MLYVKMTNVSVDFLIEISTRMANPSTSQELTKRQGLICTDSLHCYALGCSNGGYQLKKWNEKNCEEHNVPHMYEPCTCQPPFRLFPFPTIKKQPELRQNWIKQFRRADATHKHKYLEPKKGSRVCSRHFVDGCPSEANPLPQQNLGFDAKPSSHERKTGQDRSNRLENRAKRCEHVKEQSVVEPEESPFKPKNWVIFRFIMCILFGVIRTLKRSQTLIKGDVIKFKREAQFWKTKYKSELSKNQTKYKKLLKTNDDVKFYTGLDNIGLFHTIHDKTVKFVSRKWRGLKDQRTPRALRGSPRKLGRQSKLDTHDEMLMTLLWLRQGLLRKDLADRFNLSVSAASRICHAWLSALSVVLGSTIYWPTKEQVASSKPKRYNHLPDIFAIIDCTEFFIETPKDRNLQQQTWSSYKHHNTGKLLIAVAPNSTITFVSKVYNGRASDKEIVLASGFLDKMAAGDMLMADKGFQIVDDCAVRFITLEIPPGKRGHAQMSKAANSKTARIAKLRIIVEQVISNVKTYRILKNTVPINTIPYIDKIVTVCCGLVNLTEPIYKDN